jgi:hypothetical protein
MRRLVSIPVALLLSFIVAGTAFASICGNESKPQDKGQHSQLWINFVTGSVTVVNGTPNGSLRGGYVDVFLDFDGGGVDCVIDDTFILSEHKIGHIAPGQLLDELGLAVNPAVHRFTNPGGSDAGVGFADASAGCFG